MPSYENAFVLNDDPFGPMRRELLNNASPLKMRRLYKNPLMVHEEPALWPLYCTQLGPFESHMSRFQQLLEGYTYALDPPTMGAEPFLFHIRGSAGTGKTTLASVMIRWIQRCSPQKLRLPFEPWKPKEDLLPTEQEERIDNIENVIKAEIGEEDYCFVVVDNIKEGALRKVLNMYERLEDFCTLFMFLLSSHDPLLHKDWRNEPFDPQIFDTSEMTPEDAVDFVKHRIGFYRTPANAAILNEYELFPFREDDIHASITQAQETPDQRDIVTIRMLNETLHYAIRAKIGELDEDFNIAELSTAEAENHLISVILSSQHRILRIA